METNQKPEVIGLENKTSPSYGAGKCVSNFGRNVSFTPNAVLTPHTEEEVLAILDRHRGRKIRCIGRLHSWSKAPAGEDIVIDLRHLNQVRVERRGAEQWASIGAGCQIKRVLAELARTDVTLPTLGLITEQTVVGAATTGTHGSGKNSLAHYLDEVRIATYDPASGAAVIRVVSSGPELQAARCSLGCLGVILSVGFRCKDQYQVEEHFHRYEGIESVLAAEDSYPLQQFFFVPWRWDYFAQHRRETNSPRSRWARLYRWYFFLVFDLTFHLVLLVLVREIQSRNWIKFFYRRILGATVIRNWKVVDESQEMLVMEHELFRHIEIEVFVKRSDLEPALLHIRDIVKYFDGDKNAVPSAVADQFVSEDLAEEWELSCGTYSHHYPICVRRVLPDDTLLSMTSDGSEPSYALSFISYARPSDRDSFFRFARFLCKSMATLFAARCHWGKVCPHSPEEVERLYPHLSQFREIANDFDPNGVFRNEWIGELLFRD